MTQDTIHLGISEDVFDEQFPLVRNHLNPNATWGFDDQSGCLFETYGEELDFVRQQDRRCVWTFMDGDGQHVASGIHFVNRLGYLISKVPVPNGVFIEVRIPSLSDDSNDATAPNCNDLMTTKAIVEQRLTDLSDTLNAYCDANGLEHLSADELLCEQYGIEPRNESHIVFLNVFIAEWDSVESDYTLRT